VNDRSASDVDDFEDLFDNAPCGYISADGHCRIRRANKTLCDWLGLTCEEVAGRHFSDLLSVGGKLFYETHFAPMLRMHGAFQEVALDLETRGRRKLPVIVNAVEQRDGDGRPRAVRITLFAATERRRYERNLLSAKASAEQAVTREQETGELREQFIAVLGHDLRNPLAAITAGIRILQREPLSDRSRKVVGLMEGSAVRASVLIDNVLDFARGRLGGGIGLSLERNKPLARVIEQVVAELRSISPHSEIRVAIDIADHVVADHVRIGQLVSNLLGNALTHGAKDRPVTLDARTKDGTFELSVANGGEPIPADNLASLFRPFSRGEGGASQPGLGLGLHIASEIAKAHGGTLTASSSQEETRFTLRMPVQPDES
jgi:sigma-B regulation protein RsbU (phosphoserine phosphatase)